MVQFSCDVVVQYRGVALDNLKLLCLPPKMHADIVCKSLYLSQTWQEYQNCFIAVIFGRLLEYFVEDDASPFVELFVG